MSPPSAINVISSPSTTPMSGSTPADPRNHRPMTTSPAGEAADPLIYGSCRKDSECSDHPAVVRRATPVAKTRGSPGSSSALRSNQPSATAPADPCDPPRVVAVDCESEGLTEVQLGVGRFGGFPSLAVLGHDDVWVAAVGEPALGALGVAGVAGRDEPAGRGDDVEEHLDVPAAKRCAGGVNPRPRLPDA